MTKFKRFKLAGGALMAIGAILFAIPATSSAPGLLLVVGLIVFVIGRMND
jgi:membrane-bound ClpP family serine protease